MKPTFENISGIELDAMTENQLDELEFGLIALDEEGVAQRYNATESSMAGLRREAVIGSVFFEEIAQCMNNYLVAQRFEDQVELDDIIPYVLTLRMRPTPVRMRLLKSSSLSFRYILIQR